MFEDVKVGTYYDFGDQVSLEVRHSDDPYIVFTDTKYHIGADVNIFWYMALAMASLALLSLVITCCHCT